MVVIKQARYIKSIGIVNKADIGVYFRKNLLSTEKCQPQRYIVQFMTPSLLLLRKRIDLVSKDMCRGQAGSKIRFDFASRHKTERDPVSLPLDNRVLL